MELLLSTGYCTAGDHFSRYFCFLLALGEWLSCTVHGHTSAESESNIHISLLTGGCIVEILEDWRQLCRALVTHGPSSSPIFVWGIDGGFLFSGTTLFFE